MSSGRFLDKTLKVDWFLLILTIALMACGVVLVYSATNHEKVVFYETFWFRQIIYFVCGSAIAAGIVFLRLDWLKRMVVPMYTVSLIVTVSVSGMVSASITAVLAIESANACGSGMGSLNTKTREWLFFRFTFSLTEDSLEQPKRAIMALRPRVNNKKWGTRIAHPQ